MNIQKMLNRYFRTKANQYVRCRGWKFRLYMWLIRLTDERI